MLIAAMKLAQTTWVRRAIAGFARDVEGKVATVVSSLLQNLPYRAPGVISLNGNEPGGFTRSDMSEGCENYGDCSGIKSTLKCRGGVPEDIGVLCRLRSVPSLIELRVLVSWQLFLEQRTIAPCHGQEQCSQQKKEEDS